MPKTYKIALIPGDGTGPEALTEAVKALTATEVKEAFQFEMITYDIGGERYLKTGEVLPLSVLEELKEFDAILLGAIGHPKVKPGILEKGLLLELRFQLVAG